MEFPLTLPDENAIAAMQKSWQRHTLERYLVRWANSEMPQVDERFWEFDWRGCDVGCGFGRYLLLTSPKHSERGYVGIDKGSLRGSNMIKRFEELSTKNLFGLHGNAIPILASWPDACLDEITIFYPNPWWPSKHRKKRWSYHPIIPKMVNLLKPGGRIILCSNEAFYLAEWQYALTHHPEAGEMSCEYAGPIQVTEGRTHFEVKFINEGVPCGEIRMIKAST